MGKYFDNETPEWLDGGEIVPIEPPLKREVDTSSRADSDKAGYGKPISENADSPKAGYGTPLKGRSPIKNTNQTVPANSDREEPKVLEQFAKGVFEAIQNNPAEAFLGILNAFANSTPVITQTRQDPPSSLKSDLPSGRDWVRATGEDAGSKEASLPWAVKLKQDGSGSVAAGKLLGYYIENDGNPDNPEELPKYVQIKTVAKFGGGDIDTIVEGFVFGRVAIEETVGLGETPYYYELGTAAGDEFLIEDRFASAGGTITVGCEATLPKSTSTEWVFEIAEIVNDNGTLKVSPTLMTNPIINLQAKTIFIGP